MLRKSLIALLLLLPFSLQSCGEASAEATAKSSLTAIAKTVTGSLSKITDGATATKALGAIKGLAPKLTAATGLLKKLGGDKVAGLKSLVFGPVGKTLTGLMSKFKGKTDILGSLGKIKGLLSGFLPN